jgi:hypothetical protein
MINVYMNKSELENSKWEYKFDSVDLCIIQILENGKNISVTFLIIDNECFVLKF